MSKWKNLTRLLARNGQKTRSGRDGGVGTVMFRQEEDVKVGEFHKALGQRWPENQVVVMWRQEEDVKVEEFHKALGQKWPENQVVVVVRQDEDAKVEKCCKALGQKWPENQGVGGIEIYIYLYPRLLKYSQS